MFGWSRLNHTHHSNPSESGASFPYIALNYCWGTGKPLTTKTDNFAALKAEFPLSSLPQALQDAIVMTQKIGQRYIWRDALCIIQASPTGWEVEASRMASVYQNAFFDNCSRHCCSF